MNRTDLQECIAENINKAIIPTELSLRDENLNESLGIEGNTSIMAELNSAIKSIVEATESDPVFEKFLNDIIGPQTETDSPEEDGEGKFSPKPLVEYVSYFLYRANLFTLPAYIQMFLKHFQSARETAGERNSIK